MLILVFERTCNPMQRRCFVQNSLGALAAAALPVSLEAAEVARLSEIAATRGLLFGAAVSDPQLKRPELVALLAEQCSILVAENQMKWRATHPEPNRYDFVFFQAEDGIRDLTVTGVQTCALPISPTRKAAAWFDEQLKGLRANLEDAQAKLAQAKLAVQAKATQHPESIPQVADNAFVQDRKSVV